MARVTWNAPSKKIYESGVDRGMLYVAESKGVPWNGLVSVTESPSGGEVTPYYIDGLRYLNHVALEEFAAVIEAYTYPREFDQCDGTTPVSYGLFATRQPRRSFGLAYRTMIGNDVQGLAFAYKLHLVYNAIATPTDRANVTMSDSPEIDNFSWEVVTKPPSMKGFKPTTHFVIDSRETPAGLMTKIEQVLYGTPTSDPYLPDVEELIFMFTNHSPDAYDAEFVGNRYFFVIDAGHISTTYTDLIDANEDPLAPGPTDPDPEDPDPDPEGDRDGGGPGPDPDETSIDGGQATDDPEATILDAGGI